MNERALQFLVQSQNPDGGWGYRVNGMSYVEPTAAALLTLDGSDNGIRAKKFLLSLQQKDGGWGIAAIDSESGWMTAWAVIALATLSDTRDAVARGAAWLLGTTPLIVSDENLRAGVRRVFKIDSALRGFPWQLNDASWVHPTALTVLALISAGKRAEPRVREALDYLFDRAVEGGGWNVGNPWMIDKKIPATIQDTAMALLALYNARMMNDSRVDDAIRYLRDALAIAETPAELAWGIFALRSIELEMETGDWTARLNTLQRTDGSWNGNPFITAIAMTT